MKLKLFLKWTEITSIIGICSLIFTILKEFSVVNWIAGLISVNIFAIVFGIWSVIKAISLEDNRFQIIKDFEAEFLEKTILNSEMSMIMTHFTSRVPSNKYISILLNKIDKGVSLTRIIPNEIDKEKEEYKWLKKFNGKKFYKENKASLRLPFDIFIFDNSIVILAFPPEYDHNYFNQIIVLQNNNIATIFKGVIQNIKNNR